MADTTRGRLLLIDDEAMIRVMLTDLLESFGYAVDAAEDGSAALAAFRPGCYQVIITDLLMPGLSGLEVAERVRRLDATVPIVLLTGSGGASTAADARAAGVTVVYKPVSLPGLQAALDTACGSQVSPAR